MVVSAYEPNDIYVVSMYNHTGDLYLTLTGWDRLDYAQRLNNPWNHTADMHVSDDGRVGCADGRKRYPSDNQSN